MGQQAGKQKRPGGLWRRLWQRKPAAGEHASFAALAQQAQMQQVRSALPERLWIAKQVGVNILVDMELR